MALTSVPHSSECFVTRVSRLYCGIPPTSHGTLPDNSPCPAWPTDHFSLLTHHRNFVSSPNDPSKETTGTDWADLQGASECNALAGAIPVENLLGMGAERGHRSACLFTN